MDANAAARGRLTASRHLPALIAYAALTAVLTWPLVLSPGTLVPEDLGDPLLTALILWWNAQQLPFTETWWNGTFFFPGSESLALSDHRVGLGVIATPLLWLGASPLTTYGLTFLLSWWLSTAAAYALVWTVTANRAAAFAGGLIFGFNPFRADHLAHLELLASYCLPVILLALHRWLATRRRIWLLALSGSLLLQALTSGYYFFFMAVFIALWLLWFARGLSRREYAELAVALATPLVALSPVLLHYRRVHDAMGLARSIGDIKQFSADIIGFLTAPDRLWLWNSPDAWHRTEGDIMPGLVAVLLVVAAAVAGRNTMPVVPASAVVVWLRRVLLVVIVAEIGIAMLPWFVGPIAFSVAGINISTRGQDKPLAVAFLCAIVWLATSRRFVAAFTARSRFAFYCVATAVMFVLALGPEGRLMGHPVLYKPPYAWLMLLPGFEDSFRVPARFAMLAILALSVAAGLALVRLTSRLSHRGRLVATSAIVAAIVAEGWIYPFPFTPAPRPFELPSDVPASAAILELPTGVYEDALAMFHTTMHRRRTVNGMSGYFPPHYQILTQALNEGDDDVLAVLRRHAGLAIVRYPDRDGPSVTFLEMQAPPPHATSQPTEAIRPLAITTDPPIESPHLITDDDHRSAWLTVTSQTGAEVITLALPDGRAVAGVEMTLGPHVGAFARAVAVELSADGQQWRSVATADGASAAFEAALRDPKRIPVTIRFAPERASHMRIRQTGRSKAGWAVAELRVLVPVE